MKRVVVYAGTENIYHAMWISLCSLLRNNQIDQVYLLIETDNFPYELPKNVKTINVRNQTYFPKSGINYRTRWTYMTMMRCALGKILTENRCLWLDCDTIVDGDISELFDLDIGDCYYAGVREPQKCINRTYINAGVLLLNLEQIRKDGIEDKLIESLNTEKRSLPDQDAINEIAQGHIFPIGGQYNVCPFTEQAETKKIYHYAGQTIFTHEPKFVKYRILEGEL